MRLCLKNYVFVETDLDFDEFSIFVNDHVRPMQGFIKLLKHDSEGMSLSSKEMIQVCGPDFVVESWFN